MCNLTTLVANMGLYPLSSMIKGKIKEVHRFHIATVRISVETRRYIQGKSEKTSKTFKRSG